MDEKNAKSELLRIAGRLSEIVESYDCNHPALEEYEEWHRSQYHEYRSLKSKDEPLAGITSLCLRAYETSKAHGWKHDNDGQAIALMHSELSEALEAMRKPERKDEHLPHLDPVGLELADVLIRVFDFCGARGIDLATCVKEKMDYNDRRPMRHGGKLF